MEDTIKETVDADLTMEKLIQKAINKDLEQNSKGKHIKVKAEKDWRYKHYKNLLEIISPENLANTIAKARNKGKNYVIIYEQLDIMPFLAGGETRHIITKYNPYGKGTIHDILTTLLPKGYEAHYRYDFFYFAYIIYISWGEIPLWDLFMGMK
jgi:hypothetical protein